MQNEKKRPGKKGKAAAPNEDLDQILLEINSSIKKDTSGKLKEVGEEANQAQSGGSGEPEKTPEKTNKEAPLRKPRSRPSERETGPSQADSPALEAKLPEDSGSFARTAKIIPSEPEEETQRRSATVKHIAVTAVEVVEEPEIPHPPRHKPEPHAEDGKHAAVHHRDTVPPPRTSSRRKRPRMTRREKLTALFGVIVSLFFVIGVISTITTGVNFTHDMVNSTAKKEEFAKFVFPLVIADIPEFDDPQALDNSAIISSAIWAFIIDDNDKSKYPTDDFGEMTVPDVDIDPYIRKLYGNEIKIQHQTVDGSNVQMYYDAENKCYLIESTPSFLPYTPRVDKIVRDKDVYTLKVSYVLPDAVWNMDKTHKNARVDKELEYKLQETKTGYQILSVKLLQLTDSGNPETGSLPDDQGGLLEQESSLPVVDDEFMDDALSSLPGEGEAVPEAGGEVSSTAAE